MYLFLRNCQTHQIFNTSHHSILFLQDCFNEPTDFYDFQTLISRNETCFMNETCNFERFLVSSTIESEDEFAETTSENQLLENNQLSEQDARLRARINLGKQQY